MERESELLEAGVCLFTNGSKTNEGVGSGIFRLSLRVEYAASYGKLTFFEAMLAWKIIKKFSQSGSTETLESNICNSRTV